MTLLPAPDERLLRGQGQVLRARVDSQRTILEGMAKENRALGQEVDLYANALEHVIAENKSLRLENDQLRAEIADLRARG